MCPDLRHFTSARPHANVGDIPRQLRELPPELPPPYDWAEFRQRSRDRFLPRRNLVTWPHAAAAAGITAVVAAMAMLGTADRTQEDVGDSSAQVAVPSIAPGEAANEEMTPTRAPSSAQAQQTREWLARQPAEPALVRVGPRIAVANLEDRIAWFDAALTDEHLQGVNADHVKVLQQERARLVSSLAQVRYAEALAADGS
jgi:hypothetical protein